uniref:Uncharacterized protein n=1 Tax=Setaria digitata TaxID=48799 RepID=A0A915PXA8_9BILA
MLSHKKTWWMTNTRSSLPRNCPSNVSHIPAPISEMRRTVRCFADIGEIVNCRGLADTSIDKTPVGIYTRVSTKRRNSKVDIIRQGADWASEKYPCSICSNKKLCLCPSCINHKVRFSDKHDLQKVKEYGKKCFAREIEKILATDISLAEAIHATHESIEYLKQNIIDRKKSIKKKKAALKVERCRGHEKVLSGPPGPLAMFVDAYKDKLQEVIQLNAQWFFKIFPIERIQKPEPVIDDAEKRCREMIAEACQEESVPSTVKTLVPAECGTSSFYTVCDCDAPDRPQYKILKGWLTIGIPAVPGARPVHNMFAALVYTIQLVNLLTVNFDVCIPGQISFQEFSSCRKWTEGLFDTDIFKLNHAVVVLCLSLGIESNLIEPLNPFANLLLLSDIVTNSSAVVKAGHHTLTSDLAAVLEEDLRQICWAERERTEEDEWYIVRYRDNYYEETYDVSPLLRPIPSLNDLEEMLRDFSAFATPSSRCETSEVGYNTGNII